MIMLVSLMTSFSGLASDKILTEGSKLGQWTMDLDAVKKKSNGKPILINFTGSDWCGWCKLMEKDVFKKEAWWKYAEKNVNMVWIDFPSDKSKVPQKFVSRNELLAKKYGVQGFPTYIILSADGSKVLGTLGAGRGKTPKSFAKEVDALIKK